MKGDTGDGKARDGRARSAWVWAAVVLLAIIFAGCIGKNIETKSVGDVYVDLFFQNPPEFGQVSVLYFKVTPQKNASHANVTIIIPEGLEVVEGNPNWNGKISINKTVNFTLKIKPIKNGDYTIRATIFNELSEQEVRFNQTELLGGNTARLHFTIPYGIEQNRDNESLRVKMQNNNKPQGNVNARLELSNSPKNGELSELIFTIIPFENEKNVNVEFILPDGIQIIDGTARWEGDLYANNIYNFSIKIKPIMENDFTVRGVVSNLRSGGGTARLSFSTYSKVSNSVKQKNSEVDVQTKINEININSMINISENKQDSIGVSSASGIIYIQGKFETYNGLYSEWQGVYGATVEIYDQDTFGDDLLGTLVIENPDGSFSTSVSNNDGEGGGQEVYLKFIADNNYVDVSANWNPYDYWAQTNVRTEASDDSTLVFNYQSSTTDQNSGAWHVLREVYRGVNYENIKNYVGKVTVEWPYSPGIECKTTCQIGTEILLLLGDRWDDEVILHEYGHFVMRQIYGYMPPTEYCNSPGETEPNCGHSFSSPETVTTAWVEGWANFFQGAVRNNPSYNDGDIDAGGSFTLESSWSPSGENVEGNIEKSLWDMFDNSQVDDSFNDDFQTPFNNIFNTFKDSETSYTGSGNGGKVDVINEFWINWFQFYDSLDQMNRIFYNNGIDYNIVSDTTPPTIIGNTPTGGNVPVNTQITVTFSEAMNQASAETAFSISPVTGGTTSWSGNTLTFTPNSNLAYNTQYTVTVGTGAEDLAGNNLQSSYSWQFTTSSTPDTIPPDVIANNPTGTNVFVNASISITFSEVMNKASLESALMISPAIAGSPSWSGNTLTYTLGSNLAYSTQYTVTVGTGARDLANNNLQTPFIWQFTTVPTNQEVPSYCVDTSLDLSNNENINYYLERIVNSPYCANNWHEKDYDGDGYNEHYLLVGETYYQWSYGSTPPIPGHKINDFGEYGLSTRYGCTSDYSNDPSKSSAYCDSQAEYSWQSKPLNTPSTTLSSFPMYIFGEDESGNVQGWGWGSYDLSWITNGHVEYAHVKDIEPTYTISTSPWSQTMIAGRAISYIVNINNQGSFSTPVTLSCSGLPSDSTCDFSPNPASPATTSTLTISSLSSTPIGTYTITIIGTGGGDIRITTSDLAVFPNNPPYPPYDLSPGDDASNQPLNPILSWTGGDPDGDTVTYTVYLDTNSIPITPECSTTSTSCLVTGLDASTTYYWKVVASDGLSDPVESPTWSFTTTNPPYPPDNPTPSNGGTNQRLKPTLSWTGSDPDGDSLTYKLYLNTDSNPATQRCLGPSTSCSNLALNPSSTYYWKVLATDDKGASTFGPIWSFTTTNPPYPPSNPFPQHLSIDEPIEIKAFSCGGGGGLSSCLYGYFIPPQTWEGGDPDGDIVTYTVSFDTISNPTSTPPYGVGGYPAKYDTTYYWKVLATDDKDASTQGPIWSFTTEPSPEINLVSDENAKLHNWRAQNFPAFWYDFGIGSSERLIIDPIEPLNTASDRTLENGHLIYYSSRQMKEYNAYSVQAKTIKNGLDRNGNKNALGGYYATIGWQGEKYIALNGKANKLTKLIFEQDKTEKKTLTINRINEEINNPIPIPSEQWDLYENYSIAVMGIEFRASPRQVWFELRKDSIPIENYAINEGSNISFISGTLLINATLDSVFGGISSNMVKLRNVTQYSEIDGHILADNLTHQFISGNTNGTNWTLPEDYNLILKDIDVKAYPRHVWLALSLNGTEIDNAIVSDGDVYTSSIDIAGEINVPIFVTYIDTVFTSANEDKVQLKYSWLLSNNVQEIKPSDIFGNMEVTSVNDRKVTTKNNKPLELLPGSTVDIMGNFKFKVANNNSVLRFYPTFITPYQERYDTRGTVFDGRHPFYNNTKYWNAFNFQGFWFDLDTNTSTEELLIDDKWGCLNYRSICKDNIIYSTHSVKMPTSNPEISEYYIMGWQGEKFAPIYTFDKITGTANSLDASNISRWFIDNGSKSLSVGEIWNLGNGYELTPTGISGNSASLAIKKDSISVYSTTINPGVSADIGTHTMIFTKSVSGVNDVPIFSAYIEISGSKIDLSNVYLMSDNPVTILPGDEIGSFEVIQVTDTGVVLTNYESISLSRNSQINILGNLGLKVSDSQDLVFYPFLSKTSQISPSLLEINKPTNNSTFLQGDMVPLSGSASGSPSPYRYEWISSIDGIIGNRSKMLISSLSSGIHEITFKVSDADGLTNSTSKTIEISPGITSEVVGEVASGLMTWDASNFPGFWNENGISGETLEVLSLDGRIIPKGDIYYEYYPTYQQKRMGLWYNTTRQLMPYKVFSATGKYVRDNGNELDKGYYSKIGLFGRPYVAINNQARKFTNLILEQSVSEEENINVSETWDLGQGYSLTLQSIDNRTWPMQAWFILDKSGVKLDERVVSNGSVYVYTTTLEEESDTPVFVTYLDNISGTNVRLKYTWLISDNVRSLQAGDIIGFLNVVTASSEKIEFSNWDSPINLDQGASINLAGSLHLKVNDTPTLEYYPEMTVVEKAIITTPAFLHIAINNGDIKTNSTNITLTLSAMGAEEMSFSNDNITWSSWEHFSKTKMWDLSIGDGLKTVFFKARNNLGESSLVNDTIILDTTLPTPGVITVSAKGDGDYTRIQEAINAASPGNTILISNGTYHENVVVNKRLNIVGSGSESTIVQAAINNNEVFLVIDVDNVNISKLTATGAEWNVGIVLNNSHYSIIDDVTILNNSAGIGLIDSTNNNIENCNINNNNGGIILLSSSSNVVSNCKTSNNNQHGILLYKSDNNIITGNNILNNNFAGIFLDTSVDNLIHNNLFNNTINFNLIGITSNKWNTSENPGNNIIGGPHLAGNVWANPTGTGNSQICKDDDYDGICDSPYIFDSNNTDYLPLAVKSVQSSTGKGPVYFYANAGSIENLTAVNLSEIPDSPPEGADLSYGIFRFNVTDIAPGGTIILNLTFPQNLPVNPTYWKYGATQINTMPHWYTIPSVIEGRKITITLTDGGIGDDDLTVNGKIKDDGGPSTHQQISSQILIFNPSADPGTILNDNGRARLLGTNITRLNVTVTGDISSVTIDLSPIGGSATSSMTKITGTDIYSIYTNATAGINLTNNLVVNVTDTSGNFNNSVGISLTVLLRGDVVRDNKINLKDLLYMRRYIAGLEPSIDKLVADILDFEGDGNVNLKDLLYLRRYLANLESLV